MQLVLVNHLSDSIETSGSPSCYNKDAFRTIDRARFGVLVKIDGGRQVVEWVVEMDDFFSDFGAESD